MPADITANDLKKAVDKHYRFNNFIDDNLFYKLVYSDCKVVKTIPGSEEAFTLKCYKDEIDMQYSRITLYVCLLWYYFDRIMSDLSDEELTHATFEGCKITQEQESTLFSHFTLLLPTHIFWSMIKRKWLKCSLNFH